MNRGHYKNVSEYFQPAIKTPQSTIFLQQEKAKKLIIHKTRTNIRNTKNPNVWGASLWLFIHISSVNYIPSSREQIIQCMAFIRSLPYMLPCANCSEHAKQFVSDHDSQLDKICSSKKSLFEFFVDFHNYVNNQLGKRLFSYEEAWNMYSNGVEILSFTL